MTVGALIATQVAYVGAVLRALRIPIHFRSFEQAISFGTAIEWFFVLVLLWFVVRIEKLPLRSMGFKRPRVSEFGWAVAFLIAFFVFLLATRFDVGGPSKIAVRLAALPLSMKAMLVVTAAVAEEICFRGYLLERVGALAGNVWWGAGVSYVIFVAPHVAAYGPGWLVYGSVVAGLVTVLYVWRRNLFATMFLHFLFDAPLLLTHPSHVR